MEFRFVPFAWVVCPAARIVDIWVPDLKFGNDARALRLAGVQGYSAVVRRNLLVLRSENRICGTPHAVSGPRIVLRGAIQTLAQEEPACCHSSFPRLLAPLQAMQCSPSSHWSGGNYAMSTFTTIRTCIKDAEAMYRAASSHSRGAGSYET